MRSMATIPASLQIVGDLHSAEDVLIDGRMRGHLHAPGATLTIGARVNGHIDMHRRTIAVTDPSGAHRGHSSRSDFHSACAAVILDALSVIRRAQQPSCTRFSPFEVISGHPGTHFRHSSGSAIIRRAYRRVRPGFPAIRARFVAPGGESRRPDLVSRAVRPDQGVRRVLPPIDSTLLLASSKERPNRLALRVRESRPCPRSQRPSRTHDALV